MKLGNLALCASLGLLLVGCSPDEEEQSSMDNHDNNQQEFQNTATDPAGPRETSPPSDMANE
ncbi:hypothetical protein [Stutzerimonas azotifigens]|uniref:Lipoprotein n=1 Tax=Stutzerimonas azotifigens TaxID=291995 RepID=A0ABR5Z084_9GAMM|nr:hypothetical protein [Stutzerimonas azotifigens]MBA1273592.1 hypothetical protein [Stutzerimonas azotifigens]